jgi:hypothetical protein
MQCVWRRSDWTTCPCLSGVVLYCLKLISSYRLGHGIYFGHADTAAGYAGRSQKRQTAFMLMLDVALGKMKDYDTITYGLTKPPAGFNSCHGESWEMWTVNLSQFMSSQVTRPMHAFSVRWFDDLYIFAGVSGTQFYDDEFVIYSGDQQRIQYLIEFS